MFDRVALLNSVDRSEVFADVEPRDAASMLVILRSDDQPLDDYRVLMGRRHQNHSFMPDVYVFPGGAVDITDLNIAKTGPEALQVRLAQFSSHWEHGAALLLAALRETYEETGIRLVKQEIELSLTTSQEDWQDLLDRVTFLSRAITPPGRKKRFDTRFFVMEIPEDHLQGQENEKLRDTDELLDLQWVTYNQALELTLHPMTRVIIEDLNDYFINMHENSDGNIQLQPSLVAFYQMIDERFQRDWLEMECCS